MKCRGRSGRRRCHADGTETASHMPPTIRRSAEPSGIRGRLSRVVGSEPPPGGFTNNVRAGQRSCPVTPPQRPRQAGPAMPPWVASARLRWRRARCLNERGGVRPPVFAGMYTSPRVQAQRRRPSAGHPSAGGFLRHLVVILTTRVLEPSKGFRLGGETFAGKEATVPWLHCRSPWHDGAPMILVAVAHDPSAPGSRSR